MQKQAHFNFINSLQSEHTKKVYSYCLQQFLSSSRKNLTEFLKLPQDKMENVIIQYLVQKKVSRELKNLIVSSIKHACDMNDVLLNWKKIKKFIPSKRTGNEISGKDRGYTHKEIQQILSFSDQRVRTAS